jgi:hypothetical protein
MFAGAGEGNRTLVISLEGLGTLKGLNEASDKIPPPCPVEDKRVFPSVRTPATPIAKALHEYFEDGGTKAGAIHLVEAIERAGASPRGRGSRLAGDWMPGKDEVAFALGKGMTPDRIEAEAEKFKNYWTAKAGAGGVKRDWRATWRNWIISALENGYGLGSHRGHGPAANSPARRPATGSDAVLAGMGRLARRVGERRDAPADLAGELDLEPGGAR